MPELALERILAASAALVLQPPTSEILAALTESEGVVVELDHARQDFYDALCVPRSGCYIPPYAHVLTAGRVKKVGNDELWNFPPPRYDGGDSLAPWYDAVSFDPLQLAIDPMLRGPHRPLDHIGFILAYAAGLAATYAAQPSEESGDSGTILAAFIAQHLQVWPERFCKLLSGEKSVYLRAVAQAVREGVDSLRRRYPESGFIHLKVGGL